MKNGPYELVIAPRGYPGKKYRRRYAYEHIVVWWKKTGAVPEKGMEIHHINMNHRDNRIENLQLVTSQEHRLIHGRINSEKASVRTKCDLCLKEIVGVRCRIEERKRRNKSGKIFCSYQCGAINQFIPD
jgi:hypothetical protein